MATSQTTIDFLLGQLSGLDDIRIRKMFGEYAMYHRDRVVALVCDDQLFVKITDPGRMLVGDLYEEGCAYRGAKPSMLIGEEILHDKRFLCELIRLTADSLPLVNNKLKK